MCPRHACFKAQAQEDRGERRRRREEAPEQLQSTAHRKTGVESHPCHLRMEAAMMLPNAQKAGEMVQNIQNCKKLQVLARRCGLMLVRRWSLLDCNESVVSVVSDRVVPGSGDLWEMLLRSS